MSIMNNQIKMKVLVLLGIGLTSLSSHAMDYDKELKKAVVSGKLARVQELINAGANVNAKDKYGDPVFISAVGGGKAIVELLLKHGADVNASNNNGYTALMDAGSRGREDIAELLLNAGANINAQDDDGNTALAVATDNDRKDIVELLLKHGADVTIKNNKGETALDKAKERSTTEWLSQKQKASYRKIGRMLLEAYIKEKKLRGAQAAAARAIEKTHALPPEISKYFAS